MTAFWSLLFVLQEPAQSPRGVGTGFFMLQMAAIFAIIYFLMIRPKVKREREHREQVAQLRKGDEVVTAGGIVGEIVHLKDDRVTVKSGETRFVVMRDRITGVPSANDNQDRSA